KNCLCWRLRSKYSSVAACCLLRRPRSIARRLCRSSGDGISILRLMVRCFLTAGLYRCLPDQLPPDVGQGAPGSRGTSSLSLQGCEAESRVILQPDHFEVWRSRVAEGLGWRSLSPLLHLLRVSLVMCLL